MHRNPEPPDPQGSSLPGFATGQDNWILQNVPPQLWPVDSGTAGPTCENDTSNAGLLGAEQNQTQDGDDFAWLATMPFLVGDDMVAFDGICTMGMQF